jgi:hypothetical protein
VTGDGWPIGILNDPDQGSATPVRLPAPDADAVLVR